MNRQKQKKQNRDPSPHQVRDELADAGDLQGFLDHLQDTPREMITLTAGQQLSRCVRRRAKKDLDGLTDDGYGMALELAVGLLARVQYVIHAGLEHFDESGKPLRGIPRDLEPWIERAERIARFITELATARARVLHLRQIADTGGGEKSNKSRSKNPRTSSAHANGRARQNGNGVHRLIDLSENHRG